MKDLPPTKVKRFEEERCIFGSRFAFMKDTLPKKPVRLTSAGKNQHQQQQKGGGCSSSGACQVVTGRHQRRLSNHPVAIRRRGVQFRSRNSIEDIRRISTISNYDLDEVIAVWGNEDEQTQRVQELKQEMSDLYNGRRASDNLTCTSIGLHVGPRQSEKLEAREATYQAVLFEQYRQYEEEQLAKTHREQEDTFLRCIDGTYDNENNVARQQKQLRDQHKLQKKKERNFKILANICRDVTRSSRRRAQKQAKQLECEVQRFV